MTQPLQMHQHKPLSGTELKNCVYALCVVNKVFTLSQDKSEADTEY